MTKIHRGLLRYGFLLVLLIIAPSVFAQNEIKSFVNGEDLFIAGDQVTITQPVNGDAYIAGGTVVINAPVLGDLMVAGGNITINGNVEGDLRAAGGNINLSSQIKQNVTIAGGSIIVSKTAGIANNLVLASGNAQIFGLIGGAITGAVGNLDIGTNIGQNVVVSVGQISLLPGSKINGDLKYTSQEQLRLNPTATVAGKVSQILPPSPKPVDIEGFQRFLTAVFAMATLASFISSLVIGFIIIKFHNHTINQLSELVTSEPLLALGAGFLAIIILPLAMILLFIGLFTIPLTLLVGSISLIIWYLVKVIAALTIGRLIATRVNLKLNQYFVFTAGLVSYFLIDLIPVFGGLITFILSLFCLGSVALLSVRFYRRSSSN